MEDIVGVRLVQSRRISARGIAYKHQGLGNLYLDQGDTNRAHTEFRQVTEIADEEHGHSLILRTLAGLAVIKIKNGEAEQGTAILTSIMAYQQINPEIRGQIEEWADELDIVVETAAGEVLDVGELVKMLEE